MSDLLSNPTPWIEESAFCGILGKTNNNNGKNDKNDKNNDNMNRPKLAQVISYYPAGEDDGATGAKVFPQMTIHDGKCSIAALLVGDEAQRSVAYTDSQEFDNTPVKGCIVSLSDWYVSAVDLEQQQQVTAAATASGTGQFPQRPPPLTLCLVVRGRVSNKGGHGIGLAKNLQDVHEATKVLQAFMAIKNNVTTLHQNLKQIMPLSSQQEEEEKEEKEQLDNNTENEVANTTGTQHAHHNTHSSNDDNIRATTGSPDDLLNNRMVGDVTQLLEQEGPTGLEKFDQIVGTIHNTRTNKNGNNNNTNLGKNPRGGEGNKQQQPRIHQQQQQHREPLARLGNVQQLFTRGKSGLKLFDRIAAATAVPVSVEDGSGDSLPGNDTFDVYRLNGEVARRVSDWTAMQDLWSNVLGRCEQQKDNQQEQRQQEDTPNASSGTSAARGNESNTIGQGPSALNNRNEGEEASNKNSSRPCSKPIENPYKNKNKKNAPVGINGSKNQQQGATPEGWKKVNDNHNPLSPIERLEDTPVRCNTQKQKGISAMLCSQDSDDDSDESSDGEDAFMEGRLQTQEVDGGDVDGTNKNGSNDIASDKIDKSKEPQPASRGEDSNAEVESQSDIGDRRGEEDEDDDGNTGEKEKTNDDTTNTGEKEKAAPEQEEREQQAQPRRVSKKRKRLPSAEAFFLNVERATQAAVRRRQMWAQLPCQKGGDRIRALLKREDG